MGRKSEVWDLLLALDRVLLEPWKPFPPCVSTVLANGASLSSHLALRGTRRCRPLSKSVAVHSKSLILAAYALRYDFFGEYPMALVWVLFFGVLSSVEGSLEALWSIARRKGLKRALSEL